MTGGAKSAIGTAKRNLIITCLGQINNLYEGHKHKVITAKAPTPSKTFGGWVVCKRDHTRQNSIPTWSQRWIRHQSDC